MIVRDAPSWLPDEAARRAAAGADPVWLSSPGLAGDGNGGALAIAEDVVAAAPREVVRGGPWSEVTEAWRAARERWHPPGQPPPPEGLPIGIGWLSYDLARRWTDAPGAGGTDRAEAISRDEAFPWPDFELRFFDALWIRSARTGRAQVVACDADAARRLLDLLEGAPAALGAPPEVGALTSDRTRAEHEAAVVRIKDYLRAGDVYQVNLARRVSAPVGPGDPVWLAARLRERAPAPHAIWVGTRTSGAAGPLDAYVVGNSPERFLRVWPDGRVETRPIKGTRPRAASPSGDAALRAALAGAAKDRAEHIMIVDLERNDLGRVCRTGSVTVEDLMRVIDLPTVFHLESTVRGRLRPEVSLDELLRATFPGGSVTGAPKRRAIEIIDELEPLRRGIYTGATGWLGAAGDLDLAVAIRTATVAAGRLSLFVGGGIVADSDPASEWEETEVKARAFRAACARDG